MAQRVHLPPSAVDQSTSAGVRIDRLEREERPVASSSGSSGSVSWVSWATSATSGISKTVGSVFFPAGASKLTIAASWGTTDPDVIEDTFRVDLDPPVAPRGGGGPVVFGGPAATYLAVGVVVLARPFRSTVSIFAVRGEGGPIQIAAGSVIVEALPAIG